MLFRSVYHSEVYKSISINKESFENFGNTIEVKLWEDFGDRVIYYDGTSKGKYKQLYYDEWFLWIGDVNPYDDMDDLWSIEDL